MHRPRVAHLPSSCVLVPDYDCVQREGIKANGKTNVIIEALLEAYPGGGQP